MRCQLEENNKLFCLLDRFVYFAVTSSCSCYADLNFIFIQINVQMHFLYAETSDTPICGDEISILRSATLPTKFQYTNPGEQDSRRFAIVIIGRDSPNAPLRKYVVSNILYADLKNGFDPTDTMVKCG